MAESPQSLPVSGRQQEIPRSRSQTTAGAVSPKPSGLIITWGSLCKVKIEPSERLTEPSFVSTGLLPNFTSKAAGMYQEGADFRAFIKPGTLLREPGPQMCVSETTAGFAQNRMGCHLLPMEMFIRFLQGLYGADALWLLRHESVRTVPLSTLSKTFMLGLLYFLLPSRAHSVKGCVHTPSS